MHIITKTMTRTAREHALGLCAKVRGWGFCCPPFIQKIKPEKCPDRTYHLSIGFGANQKIHTQFIEIKRKHGTEVVGFFYSQCTENLSRLHSSRLSFILPLKMLLHWYSLCHQPVVYFINLLVKNGVLV